MVVEGEFGAEIPDGGYPAIVAKSQPGEPRVFEREVDSAGRRSLRHSGSRF